MRYVTTTLTIALAALLTIPLAAQAQSQRKAQRDKAYELLDQHRQTAIDEILEASRSDDPMLRANAIEAMQPVPNRARPLAQLGLEDDNAAVQFSALTTIGELKLDGLGAAARDMIDHDNPSVRAAALFAARACGEDVDITPMADLLTSQDPTVRGNAAMLLGMLGDESAAPMLRDLSDTPMPRASSIRHSIVRIQTAEALVNLGDDSLLDAVRAAAFSQHQEVRVLAVQTLGKLEDHGMSTAFQQMVEKDLPIELRLVAAEALGRLNEAGDPALAVAKEGAKWPENPAVRSQAAFVLGWLERPEAATRLSTLLNDSPHAPVRLAAAAAVLRSLQRHEQRREKND